MRGARGDQASLGWLRLWAQSALKGEEKEKSTGTEAIRTSASSYRDLRTRSRRDGCCRHFPAYPEDLRSPGGSGFSSSSSRFESRPPGATLSRTPDGRGWGVGAGSRNPCTHPHRDAHAQSAHGKGNTS